MPSLLACFGCGRKESDDIKQLDYSHFSLNDVPPEVFSFERTLEELHLDANQIRDLPRQLFHCHGLKVLGLSDNDLQALPPAIASLISLNTLDLSKNAISDIPDNIKGCKQLSVVDASINPLCKLPEGFTQLLSLEELYLNDTFLEYLPANFGRLSRLRILELRENQLNTLPKSIARLVNLQRLDIGQNDFSELPEVIGSLPNLTELWFDNNKVKSIPPIVGKLKKMLFIDGSKNKIDWVASEIENCTHLTDLYLSSNNLKELPESLSSCKNLQILKLDDNALTHLPQGIGNLTHLEELIVTQNDLEALPPSVGLLRKLHTLNVDDNMLDELPPELGSCTRLKILSARSNRLVTVPGEIGHLGALAVLNLSDNLITHLPVSLAKLKLRSLWLSENQNIPTVQLQSDTDPETGQRVLTCFMLPQIPRSYEPEPVNEPDDFEASEWEEERKSKMLIKFSFDTDMDKPGRLSRAPTPYPKELKALAKHARNLHNLHKETGKPGQEPVKPVSPNDVKEGHNGTKESPVKAPLIDISDGTPAKVAQDELSVTLMPTSGEVRVAKPVGIQAQIKEATTAETEVVLKQMEVSQQAPKVTTSPSTDGELSESDNSLTVIEPRIEEKPILKEARNIKNNGSPNNHTVTSNGHAATPDSEGNYTIGDKKVFGRAEIVTTSRSKENVNDSLVKNNRETPDKATNGDGPTSPPETPDKRIKKPPPYHIAAAFSKHAGEFGDPTVEVPPKTTEVSEKDPGAGLTVKDLPGSLATNGPPPLPQSSPPHDDLETTNDTSSSSDSGYGNGKSSTEQAIDQTLEDNTSSDETSSMSTIRSPVSPISPMSPKSSEVMISPPLLSSQAPNELPSIQQKSPQSPEVKVESEENSHAQTLREVSHGMLAKPGGRLSLTGSQLASTAPSSRPASIAGGHNFESTQPGSVQRPGSLALGTLGTSSLLQRPPGDTRPGSVAARINTVGIPPAPARAVSHMGLNLTSPNRGHDFHMFRSQDLSPHKQPPALHNGFGQDQNQGSPSKRQESNGLVSIIDQVTSNYLEDEESFPSDSSPTSPKAPTVSLTSSSTTSSQQNLTSTTNSSYVQPTPHIATTPTQSHLEPVSRIPMPMIKSPTGSAPRHQGPANFTQDKPVGQILVPTPQRPQSGLPTSTPSSSLDKQIVPSLPPRSTITTTPPTVSAPKPALSRIPRSGGDLTSSLEAKKNAHNISYEEHNNSSSSIHNTSIESRIPTFGNMGRTPSTHSQESSSHLYSHPASKESRVPHPTYSHTTTKESHAPVPTYTHTTMKESSPSLTHSQTTTRESHLPTLSYSQQTSRESQIPSIGKTGRIPSSLPVGTQIPTMTRSNSNLGNESSQIPLLSSSSKIGGRTLVNKQDSEESHKSNGHASTPTSSYSHRLHSPSTPTAVTTPGTPTGQIPLYSHPTPSGIRPPSVGIPTPASTSLKTPTTLSSSGIRPPVVSTPSGIRPPAVSSPSGIRPPLVSTPSSSGIRPPLVSTPTSSSIRPPLVSPSTPASGIRPPSIGLSSSLGVNHSINTPGIPTTATSPTGVSHHSGTSLAYPGSRGSVSSVGSGTRIPLPGQRPSLQGHTTPTSQQSRILPPGSISSLQKHKVSPQCSTLEGSKQNSAWMFGQHKNARVFPVVIEKNPGLGFTIGQSHSDPDDQSIYVVTVASGGPASSALKVGDKILQVDGIDLKGIDFGRALHILNNTSNTVNLMVSRVQ
ncbi:uncharacterized protein LOC143021773 isoform X2 [Oratosquilla oratoria]|uniref:uncharacterized protein LOC143021773 isoform X2 n=1 Tax=Oratosquilla oratoria TaxID=337810 RepID=UPI003F760807